MYWTSASAATHNAEGAGVDAADDRGRGAVVKRRGDAEDADEEYGTGKADYQPVTVCTPIKGVTSFYTRVS